MMLRFYGMRLVDIETGAIRRAKNWKRRFRHLSRHSHNRLRLSKCPAATCVWLGDISPP